jgi:hypothetical protein
LIRRGELGDEVVNDNKLKKVLAVIKVIEAVQHSCVLTKEFT